MLLHFLMNHLYRNKYVTNESMIFNNGIMFHRNFMIKNLIQNVIKIFL